MAETEVEESRGSFAISDSKINLVCKHQYIEEVKEINFDSDGDLEVNDQDFSSGFIGFDLKQDLKGVKSPVLLITGRVYNKNKKIKIRKISCYAKYWAIFYQKNDHQIGFQVNIDKPNYEVTNLRSKGVNKKSGRIRRRKFGLSWLPLRPAVISVEDDERQKKWLAKSIEFNRICMTYSSEENERFFGFGEQFSHMDFKGKRIPIFVQEQGIGRGDQPISLAINLVHGNSVAGAILHGNSPTEIIETFTESIGRPPELPHWIISGAVVGMQGGTETVRNSWDILRTYDVPISSFWLQDWVGQRETLVGSQLWWNWEVDTTRYKGWQQLVKDLNNQHIKVMSYCNPCLAPTDEKPNRRRNMFEEAKKLDILVKDKDGEPYMVPNTAFDVGMLDLTHPETAPWFKNILQEMVDDGVRGWMADFGEGLPVDATLYSGEDPIAAHNRYPELWAQINREFVDECKSSCSGKHKEDPEEALVFFMRAGFRDSPKWAMLFWEGDQMVSWQANDGIKSAVVGLLSSGISGYALNHSDIGGYCAVNLPLIKYHRSEELLFRWMEFSAFTTVFRTHEGNKPSCNSQFYSNHKTLSHFARLAKVYKAWKFYRIQLVKEASEKGLPVCRHLFLHYPEDEYVQTLTYQQFLVGSEILVAPILDKGKREAKVYFPLENKESCSWIHIWTGKVYNCLGTEAKIDAPLGYPAVFVKSGSFIAETFLQNLRDLDIL
uniref:Alpha-glucosidase n=1 Tax=Chenopodium quinoa TaxID=63459 RepID=A0A803LT09_CHEQI